MYLGPYNAGRFRQVGVAANQPKLDQFWLIRTFSCTKSKFKGGLFYAKNCQLMYLRPHFAGCFEKWGVCQSAQNGLIWNFLNSFSHKIRIKRGSVLWKNLPTHVFGALHYSAGRFGQMGVLANRPKLDQFWGLRTFSCTKSKFKVGIFYEKNCHLM